MGVYEDIIGARCALGMEFGSTRIKAVLIDSACAPIASGSFDWENQLSDEGYFTYPLEEAEAGMQAAYAALKESVRRQYGVPLRSLAAIGISGMMHGYLPFDEDGALLTPFRTWRNTNTARAAHALSEALNCNIPLRWSVAHLYQALLNGEAHTRRIAHLTTLAGYIHRRLTGQNVLGIGEASGMFPVDGRDYDPALLEKADALLRAQGLETPLKALLPPVLLAGENAGALSGEGALLLDPTGELLPGIPFCPPEGDAGTGMTATHSIAAHTGNVSAGTSIFAMTVLDRPLRRAYPEIDVAATPDGKPVAMVHANTCTSELDAWVRLWGEIASAAGAPLPKSALYDLFYQKALEGDADCGELVSFNFHAGEPVCGVENGCPMLLRRPQATLNASNLARCQLYASMAALRMGMDLLRGEGVSPRTLVGHGGLFKTPLVGQRLMAGALDIPVTVLENAGEGGPWGMALLASYMAARRDGQSLEDYLDRVFAAFDASTQPPDPADRAGFSAFMADYRRALPLAREAGALWQ